MSRPRSTNSDLPPRTYFKNGAYHHVNKATGKWVRLSADKDEAIRKGNKLNASNSPPTSQPKYDLSASHELDIFSRAGQLRTAFKMFESARQGAISRNISFELTKQDVLNALIAAKGHCVATGIEFSNERKPGDRIAKWKPSLDRINSAGGYTIENVRVVCVAYNIAIQDHGDEVFEKLAVGFLKKLSKTEF